MANVDIGLDPVAGDLPDVPVLITGLPLIQQRIRTRLNRGLGEWFLFLDEGLPFLEWVGAKPLDLDAVSSRIQTELLAVPGVQATQDFTAVFDRGTRTVTVAGTVVAEDQQVTLISVQGSVAGERNRNVFAVFFDSRAFDGGNAQINAGGL